MLRRFSALTFDDFGYLRWVGVFGITLRYLNVTHLQHTHIPIEQSEHQTADLLWSLHTHVIWHFLRHTVEHPVQCQGHFLSVQRHLQPQVSSASQVEG